MDGLFVLSRYILENRVACEIGLYYALHIAKLRNKNALQRLLPGLGETPVRYIGLMDAQGRAAQRLTTLCVCVFLQWIPIMTWRLETSSSIFSLVI